MWGIFRSGGQKVLSFGEGQSSIYRALYLTRKKGKLESLFISTDSTRNISPIPLPTLLPSTISLALLLLYCIVIPPVALSSYRSYYNSQASTYKADYATMDQEAP